MANPNLMTATSGLASVLAEAQLGTGNSDFTVASGKAWKVTDGTVCNVSAAPCTVTVSLLSSSGGTARKVISAYTLMAGDTLDLGPYLPQMLPEGAIIRASAGTATSLDLFIVGIILS